MNTFVPVLEFLIVFLFTLFAFIASLKLRQERDAVSREVVGACLFKERVVEAHLYICMW